jgi:hypothetical protein
MPVVERTDCVCVDTGRLEYLYIGKQLETQDFIEARRSLTRVDTLRDEFNQKNRQRSCRYAEPGRVSCTWKCRCGAALLPELPTRPIRSPARRRAPGRTQAGIEPGLRCGRTYTCTLAAHCLLAVLKGEAARVGYRSDTHPNDYPWNRISRIGGPSVNKARTKITSSPGRRQRTFRGRSPRSPAPEIMASPAKFARCHS